MFHSLGLLLLLGCSQIPFESALHAPLVKSCAIFALKGSRNSWENRLGDVNQLTKVSTQLNVQPPWNAPKWVWALAWRIHKFILPVLHAFDECRPSDTFVNLAVLWWKSISGNKWGSRTYDGGVAYDLLPSITRWMVTFPLCYLYPPLHHQNVAIRTAFLDTVVNSELSVDNTTHTTVIVLGAGFDTRSIRLAQHHKNTEFFEIDLPDVVSQKLSMFKRFQSRRKFSLVPHLEGADLNNISEVQSKLRNIFLSSDSRTSSLRKIVFVSEAVLLYLQQDHVMPLLQLCLQTASQYSKDVSFCFADRIPAVQLNDADPDQEGVDAKTILSTIGLNVERWAMKPGKARHMGVARLVQ